MLQVFPENFAFSLNSILLNIPVRHRMTPVPVGKRYKNSVKLSIPHSPISQHCKQPQLPLNFEKLQVI